MLEQRRSLAERMAEASENLLDIKAKNTFEHYHIACVGLLKPECARIVWRSYPTDRTSVFRVMQCVGEAVDAADAEIKRPTRKNEQEDIESVIALAKKLRREITDSSLPKNLVAHGFERRCADGEIADVDFAWHLNGPPEKRMFGQLVILTEALDLAVEVAKQHVSRLPLRALARSRSSTDSHERAKAFRAAMVVQLRYRLMSHFGRASSGAIAAIVNGLVDLPQTERDRFDAKAVDRILRRAPAEYVSPAMGPQRAD